MSVVFSLTFAEIKYKRAYTYPLSSLVMHTADQHTQYTCVQACVFVKEREGMFVGD